MANGIIQQEWLKLLWCIRCSSCKTDTQPIIALGALFLSSCKSLFAGPLTYLQPLWVAELESIPAPKEEV